jgi:hypothetical protein
MGFYTVVSPRKYAIGSGSDLIFNFLSPLHIESRTTDQYAREIALFNVLLLLCRYIFSRVTTRS